MFVCMWGEEGMFVCLWKGVETIVRLGEEGGEKGVGLGATEEEGGEGGGAGGKRGQRGGGQARVEQGEKGPVPLSRMPQPCTLGKFEQPCTLGKVEKRERDATALHTR